MKHLFAAVLMLTVSTFVHAEIKTEEIKYSEGGVEFTGFLAYDDAVKGKRPGVLIVHEWWGHNDYVRERARMLAALGYTAFALDMYGDGKVADHPQTAGKFAGEVRSNMPVAEKRFNAAKSILEKHKTVKSDDIGAIGYCFGGGIVLEMARRGLDLKGVVSFHGSLGTDAPAQKGKVKAEVLVLNGEADSFVKPEQIDGFKQEMDAAGVKYKFINYPDAVHAFTNPGATDLGKKFNIPLAYNEAADTASWEEMQKFFKRILR